VPIHKTLLEYYALLGQQFKVRYEYPEIFLTVIKEIVGKASKIIDRIKKTP
jgi:hypothetical protein